MIQTFKTTLANKREIVPGVWHLHFKLLSPSALEFVAGQYMILRVGDVRRHFSIFSTPDMKDNFELIVEYIPGGIASTFFANLAPGQEAEFDGPAGMFTLRPTPEDKIFLATGTGIAPIRSILVHELTTNKQQSTANFYLFWGLKNRGDVYIMQEFEELAQKNPNFKFHICLTREEKNNFDHDCFREGRINQQMLDDVKTSGKPLTDFQYYLCGSRVIVESLRQFVLGLGVTPDKVVFEKF